jgi:hypothetical protein
MDAHDFELAYALSALSGVRSSFTLLTLSIAAHANLIANRPAWDWLRSDYALIIFGVFAGAELLGDKIPGFDHLLHTVHTFLAPIVGAISAASATDDQTSMAVAAVLGGINSFIVHALRAGIRVASTLLSVGMLNPILSFAEDVVAIIALIVAFLRPEVVAVLGGLATIFMVVVSRRAVDVAREQVRRHREIDKAMGPWTILRPIALIAGIGLGILCVGFPPLLVVALPIYVVAWKMARKAKRKEKGIFIHSDRA